MVMEMCLPKGKRRRPGRRRGGARRRRAAAPWPFFFLGLGAGVEGILPLLGGFQGGENSWLWVVPPENRVSGQYIVLEALPGPLDLIPWIQRLLGTSRTFKVTPRKAHKSPRSWLGRIDLIWQEFESTTSPTFGIPKLLMYPSVIGGELELLDSVWDDF
jgi:hypothetical protein